MPMGFRFLRQSRLSTSTIGLVVGVVVVVVVVGREIAKDIPDDKQEHSLLSFLSSAVF